MASPLLWPPAPFPNRGSLFCTSNFISIQGHCCFLDGKYNLCPNNRNNQQPTSPHHLAQLIQQLVVSPGVSQSHSWREPPDMAAPVDSGKGGTISTWHPPDQVLTRLACLPELPAGIYVSFTGTLITSPVHWSCLHSRNRHTDLGDLQNTLICRLLYIKR